MESQLLVLDDLDSRRELHALLHRLAPVDRIMFLKWACSQAPQGRGRLPVPFVQKMRTTMEQAYRCERANDRLTNEVYGDILNLFAAFEVDAVKVAVELERLVKRKRGK